MRYLIYRHDSARDHLCVVDARSARRALAVARGMFTLSRTAQAVREDGTIEREAYQPSTGYAVGGVAA